MQPLLVFMYFVPRIHKSQIIIVYIAFRIITFKVHCLFRTFYIFLIYFKLKKLIFLRAFKGLAFR